MIKFIVLIHGVDGPAFVWAESKMDALQQRLRDIGWPEGRSVPRHCVTSVH